ncbi:MAG: hypothetical protein LH650_03460 [Chloroflexi bacterium]|nr:hypothetical protein [Chloroflexota bacterium]
MRTTLVLDETLLRRARQRAAEQDLTLSDVVNAALREAFRATPPAARPFSMITYGRPEAPTHREPADFAVMLEGEDLAGLAR